LHNAQRRCEDVRSVMLQINEYDDDDDDENYRKDLQLDVFDYFCGRLVVNYRVGTRFSDPGGMQG